MLQFNQKQKEKQMREGRLEGNIAKRCNLFDAT